MTSDRNQVTRVSTRTERITKLLYLDGPQCLLRSLLFSLLLGCRPLGAAQWELCHRLWLHHQSSQHSAVRRRTRSRRRSESGEAFGRETDKNTSNFFRGVDIRLQSKTSFSNYIARCTNCLIMLWKVDGPFRVIVHVRTCDIFLCLLPIVSICFIVLVVSGLLLLLLLRRLRVSQVLTAEDEPTFLVTCYTTFSCIANWTDVRARNGDRYSRHCDQHGSPGNKFSSSRHIGDKFKINDEVKDAGRIRLRLKLENWRLRFLF